MLIIQVDHVFNLKCMCTAELSLFCPCQHQTILLIITNIAASANMLQNFYEVPISRTST